MKKSPGDEHNGRTQDTFASQASGMFFFKFIYYYSTDVYTDYDYCYHHQDRCLTPKSDHHHNTSNATITIQTCQNTSTTAMTHPATPKMTMVATATVIVSNNSNMMEEARYASVSQASGMFSFVFSSFFLTNIYITIATCLATMK